MTEERYKKLHDYFEEHKGMAKALAFLCAGLTAAVYIFFIAMLFIFIVRGEYKTAYEVVLVCAVGFGGCTVLRRAINSPRPYDVYPYPPTISRNKKGCSFPSRHVFSIAIIAVSAMRLNTTCGIVMVFLTVILAATRVIGGVHFVKDVFAGAGIAYLWGIIGFSILSLI